jgi:hypothetical protein
VGLLDGEKGWTGKVFTGTWTDTGTTRSTEPATGDVLDEVGTASADELSRSAAAAAEAGRTWAAADYRERAAVLRRAAELFAEHRDEITRWLVREAGKAAGAARQLAGYPQDRPVRRRDHLQIHPMALVLVREERPVHGDPVDRDQRAVDDHVGHPLTLRLAQCGPQLRRPCREQFDGFVHIPPARQHRQGPAAPDCAPAILNRSPDGGPGPARTRT